MRVPVGRLGEHAALLLELRFDEEGHDVCELDGGLLGVSKASDLLASDQRLKAATVLGRAK